MKMTNAKITEKLNLIVMQEEIIRVMGTYCFIRLDNGAEAFYHYGVFIKGLEAANVEQTLYLSAMRMARAGNRCLRCIELPVPSEPDWCWEDIVMKLINAALFRDLNGEVIVICYMTEYGRGVHFCDNVLLNGNNTDLWFPVMPSESLHIGIERILKMNSIADNVVKLILLREDDVSAEYKVIYHCKI